MSKYIDTPPELAEYFERWINCDEDVFSREMVAYTVDFVFQQITFEKMGDIDEVTNDIYWMTKGYSGKENILIPCFIIYVKLMAHFMLWCDLDNARITKKQLMKEEKRAMKILKKEPAMIDEMKKLFLDIWDMAEDEYSGWAVTMY